VVSSARMLPKIAAAVCSALAVVSPAVAQCTNVSTPGGSGCGNFTPFGIPTLQCTGSPTMGNPAFGFTANVPCTATFGTLMLGVCRSAPLVFNTGFGSGGLCGPSQAPCALFVDAAVTLPGVSRAGGFTFSVPIPNLPQLIGLRLCAQNANVCSQLVCISASQGVSVTVL
jgi:hypothetical protein